jgi:hypothetical protein
LLVIAFKAPIRHCNVIIIAIGYKLGLHKICVLVCETQRFIIGLTWSAASMQSDAIAIQVAPVCSGAAQGAQVKVQDMLNAHGASPTRGKQVCCA